MNRTTRYWLVGLLGVFIACEITVWFLLPFAPSITFTSPQMSFYSDRNGTGYPEVSVLLRNEGRFPVWYRGHESSIDEFVIEGDRLKGERHVHSQKGLSWNRLAPGESKVLPIPSYTLFDVSKIHLELRDWRGWEVTCSSQEFDFSSVPIEGVPGIGVKLPAPIPQRN